MRVVDSSMELLHSAVAGLARAGESLQALPARATPPWIGQQTRGLPLGHSLIAFPLKMGLNPANYSAIKVTFIYNGTRQSGGLLMNKYVIIIALLFLAAVAGILFQQDRHSKMLESEHSAILDLQTRIDKYSGENRELRDKVSAAQRDSEAARQAQESIRMAERKSRAEEQEQQRQVAELLERLKIEAENRKNAETALAELNEKITALSVAQIEAEEKLASLDEARVRQEMPESSDDELEGALTTLEQKKAELARLEEQRLELDEEYQITLRRQAELKEDIMRDKTFSEDLRELLEAFLRVLGF